MIASSSTDYLLEVRDLKVWFPIARGVFSKVRGHIKAVDGVTLFLRPGETLGLVGESGSGKTTLGRTVVGLEKPHGGEINFGGQSVTEHFDRRLRRRIQMVFQDPYASLNPRMTVVDLLTEGLEEYGLLQEPREEAALRLLADVGMDRAMLYRYPFEFSGGQRQRIGMARAISIRPECVVCDEPISALDVSIQAQVINLLMDLKQKYGLSYLFISHDLSVVRHIADRIAVMYLGRIVEEGPADAVIDAPKHPYTQALVSAVPIPGEDQSRRIILEGEIPSPSNPPKGCPFHPRCPHAMDLCRRDVPPEIVTDGHRVSCHLLGGAPL